MEGASLITNDETDPKGEQLPEHDQTPSGRENLSNIETMFNICCGITGTGLLAMAFVFRCAGLWALLIVPTVAIAGNYTGQILIDLLYETDSNGVRYRAREGYLDIGDKLAPNFGKVFVNAVNLVENLAHCVLILLLAGGIMNEIVPFINYDMWTVICSLPLFAVIFLERIRSLSKVAMATVGVGVGLIAFTTTYSLRFTANWNNTIKTGEIFDLKRFSLGLGITIVTYACQPYLPFIEKDMKNREDFGKIMNISYGVVTVIKIVSGLFIYLAYENMTHPLMTLDLPHGWLRTVSSLLLFVVAMAFFVFPMFTVFNIIDQNWPKRYRAVERVGTIKCMVRLLVMCLAIVLAVITPHFGIGIALVGNFTANILIFIVPCLCHIKFNYPNIPLRYLVIDVTILIVFTVLGVIGIISSTSELVLSSKVEDLNPTDPIKNL